MLVFLLKIVDCFIDCYGSVNSERVNFLLVIEYLFIKILSKFIFLQFKSFFNE